MLNNGGRGPPFSFLSGFVFSGVEATHDVPGPPVCRPAHHLAATQKPALEDLDQT